MCSTPQKASGPDETRSKRLASVSASAGTNSDAHRVGALPNQQSASEHDGQAGHWTKEEQMRRVLQIGGFVAAGVLIVFGVVAIVMGVTGRNTVRNSLTQEHIVGPGVESGLTAGKSSMLPSQRTGSARARARIFSASGRVGDL
jgi:hypothetical protein